MILVVLFGQRDDHQNMKFALGHNPEINGGHDYILYCWHNVPGLQKFGTYMMEFLVQMALS